MQLTVSIVTFRSAPEILAAALQSLSDSVVLARESLGDLHCELHIIENELIERQNLKQVTELMASGRWEGFDDVHMKTASSNLGYGRGHNLAITDPRSDYHLILNPDVILSPEAILCGLKYLQLNPSVVMVSPKAEDGAGNPLHLCKQFPRVFDLFLRGFMPASIQEFFTERLARYEMRSLSQAVQPVSGLKIVSGCCMLIRAQDLRQVGGFDPIFFLYFEDFDLSIRLSALGQLVYLPEMKIVHYGGNAAKKGLRHIHLFIRSGLTFYRRYGWRWY